VIAYFKVLAGGTEENDEKIQPKVTSMRVMIKPGTF
jgi:hypothetical protein